MLLLKNTHQRYGLITLLFHWGMALLIIGMLILGLFMEDFPSPERATWYGIHKSLGAIILGLALLRLGWRLISLIPPLPEWLPRWQKLTAHAVHWLLYGLMIAMPLSGWLLSSAAGKSVPVFDWFILPALVEPSAQWRHWFRAAHGWLAYGLMAALAIHIGAALLHHFIYKDGVLLRMLGKKEGSA